MSTVSCPGQDEWRAFLMGQTPDADTARMAEHLEHCTVCLDTLSVLDQDGPLIDALRSKVSNSLQANRPLVLQIIRGRSGIHIGDRETGKDQARGEPPTVYETADSNLTRDLAPPAADSNPSLARRAVAEAEAKVAYRDLVDLLAPVQAADELGRLGGYRILKVLGQGGMGVVFLAEDPGLQRLVALKAMRPGLAANRSNRERFLREARAAAAIKHEHVVTIYQVAEDRGVAFLAMDYTEGETLEERLKREKRLPFAEVLRIGRALASALAAAHEKKLIHRDVKPSNIWLVAGTGSVKVLDFGLARAMSQDRDLTPSGALIGTPAFMAPEQILQPNVTPAADLFSLGCVLYVMATGEQPFQGKDVIGVMLGGERPRPSAPRELNPALPEAFSELVMRLLEPDPGQRPDRAVLVGDALQHMTSVEPENPPVGAKVELAGKPVHQLKIAKPGKPRRKLLVAGLLLSLAVGLLALIVILFRTPSGEVTVETEDPDIELVVREGRLVRIHDKKTGQKWNLDADKYTLAMADQPDGLTVDLPGKDGSIVVKRQGRKVVSISWKKNPPPPPDKDRLFAPVMDHRVPADNLERSAIPVAALAWSGGGDPKQAPPELVAILGDGRLRLLDISAWPAFSPDGKLLAAPSGSSVMVFDAWTGAYRRALSGHTARVMRVAFSSDGRTLASASDDSSVRLWDVATGQERGLLSDHKGIVWGVAFSPDGATLASSGGDGVVRLWSLPSGKLRRRMTGHSGGVGEVVFHPDGTFLASRSGDDGTVRVWDVEKGELLHTLEHDKVNAWATVAFSPDGRWLATGTDGSVRLWDAATIPQETVKHVRDIRTPGAGLLAFTSKGEALLTTGHFYKAGEIKRWETATGKELGSWASLNAAGWGGNQLSPDGKTLAVVRETSRMVHLYDAVTGKPRFPLVGHTHEVTNVAFSPDGRLLASGGEEGTVLLWDLSTGREANRLTGHSGPVRGGVAFSPDGKLLATSSYDKTVQLWEARRGKHLWTFTEHTDKVEKVAFSPDGKLLAAGARNGVVWVWNVAPPTPMRAFKELKNVAAAVSFSPDSRWLAVAAEEGFVRVWDLTSGATLRTLPHPGRATGVFFLADGDGLVTGGESSVVRRWSLASAEPRQLLWGGGGFGWGLAVSGDGRLVASCGEGGGARVWDLGANPPRRQTFRLFPHDVRVDGVALSPEGRYLATGNPDGTIHVFRLAPPGRKQTELPRPDDRAPRSIPKGAVAWTEANLRAGKVLAPDLSKARVLHHDDFNGKDGLFGKDRFAETGLEKGRLYVKGGAYSCRWYPGGRGEYADFACRLEGRVLAPASDGWALVINRDGAGSQGIQVSLDSEARLRISPWVYHGREENYGPRVGPLEHAAIRKDDAFNELLVVVRGRRVEVYVNRVAVCRPVTMDRDFTPGHLILQSLGRDKGVHVEFERITVWSADKLPEPLLIGKADPPLVAPRVPAAAEDTLISGMKFVHVPEGTFWMGWISDDKQYDMHGNVWQWCEDLWQPAGSDRVNRAGSWFGSRGPGCRAGLRDWSLPSDRFRNPGLRLARVPSGGYSIGR